MGTATDNFREESQKSQAEVQKAFDETTRSAAELRTSILQNVEAARNYRNELRSGVTPDIQKFQQVTTQLQVNLETLRLKMAQTSDPKQIEGFTRQIGLLQNQIQSLKTTFDSVKPIPLAPSIGIIQSLENSLTAMRQKVVTATSTTEIVNFNKTITALESQLKNYRSLGVEPALNANARLAGSTNQAGAALTDVGRILQDLPFGFIAIQNNLSPLVESWGRLREKAGSTGGALRDLGATIMGAGGLGLAFNLITSALTFASVGLQAWQGHVNKTKEETKNAAEENEKYLATVTGISGALLKGSIDAQKELTSLDTLYRATQNVTLSQKDRLAAVDEIQKKFPDYFGNMKAEEILTGKAASAYNTLKDAILASARARAAGDLISQNQKQVLINEQRITEEQAAQLKLRDRIAAINKNPVFFEGNQDMAQLGEIHALTNKIADSEKKINDIKTANSTIDKENLRLANEVDKQIAKGGTAAITGRFDTETKAREKADKARDKSKKDQDKADKEQERADAKKAKELEDFNNLFTKLVQERAELSAKSVEDDRMAQIAVSDAHFAKIKEDAQKEVDQAKITGDHKKQLQIEVNKVLIDADKAAAEARADINKKYDERQQKLVDAANAALFEINDSKYDKDLKAIEKRYFQLADTIKKGGLMTAAVEKSITESKNREIDDLNIKTGADRIKKETDLQVATIKVSEKFVGQSKEVERKKQIAILEAQAAGAQEYIDLLLKNGKGANNIEVKNAQQALNNIKSGIKNLQKPEGLDMFDLLGLNDLTDAQKAAVGKAAATSLKSVKELTDFVTDQYQRQIDKKQELIDADKKAVDDLEKQLDKEKQLRDQGLANNVDGLQKELDQKKAIRDQDIKDQQDLIEQQNNVRRAQLVIDTVTQASNLITAASEIFAALAGIPFIGIPLAITTIGLMSGAFIAAKVRAFQMVGEGQKFAEGGYIDGPAHTEGGKKYRSIDGSGEVLELEGGEFVTRKKAVSKYGELLEAINSDQISRMSDEGLKEMLAGMGIHFETDQEREAVQIGRERDELKAVVIIQDTKEELKSIAGNMAYLADQARNKTERWEDSEFEYIRQGNKVTRIKK